MSWGNQGFGQGGLQNQGTWNQGQNQGWGNQGQNQGFNNQGWSNQGQGQGQGFINQGQGFSVNPYQISNHSDHHHHKHKHHQGHHHKDNSFNGQFLADPNHLYKIFSAIDISKYLELHQGSLRIDTWHGGDDQKFRILMQNGAYILKNGNGDVVHVHHNSNKDGASLEGNKNFDHNSSLFHLMPANHSNGQCFYIKTPCGKVFDIYGGKPHNHTKVVQWEYHGGLNQVWYIAKA